MALLLLHTPLIAFAAERNGERERERGPAEIPDRREQRKAPTARLNSFSGERMGRTLRPPRYTILVNRRLMLLSDLPQPQSNYFLLKGLRRPRGFLPLV